MSNESKLAQLRAKTDADLARLVRKELNLGMQLVSRDYIRARKLCAEVASLLPVIGSLDTAERRSLISDLSCLREMLERRPALVRTAG
jgi:hypothetical protein